MEDESFQHLIRTVLMNTLASTGRHSMIILLIAMLVFFWTLSKKPTYNKTVNRISSCTLGVYLFHENDLLILPKTASFLLTKLLESGILSFDKLFPVKHILFVLTLFACGTVLELIRDITIQKPFMRYVNGKYSLQFKRIDDWFNSFEGQETSI